MHLTAPSFLFFPCLFFVLLFTYFSAVGHVAIRKKSRITSQKSSRDSVFITLRFVSLRLRWSFDTNSQRRLDLARYTSTKFFLPFLPFSSYFLYLYSLSGLFSRLLYNSTSDKIIYFPEYDDSIYFVDLITA